MERRAITDVNYEHYIGENHSTDGNYEHYKGERAMTNVKAAGADWEARCARRPSLCGRRWRRGAEHAAGAGSGGELWARGGRSVAVCGLNVA